MKHDELNRRRFIKGSVGMAAAAGLAATQSTRGSRAAMNRRAIRLGGPTFVKTDDPEELALAHRKMGYRAAYCPGVSLNDADRILAIEKAFAKHDVVIAEVGRWCNLLDPDPAKRKKNMKTVTDGLALADAVGARCCVDIAGSFNPEVWYGPHPRNLSEEFFDAAVGNARTIIDTVKPQRAKFSYEMMAWSLPDSPEAYLRMIKAVERDAFAVHLDPCNLVNSPTRYYRSTELIDECFDKLGPWIVSCHAKDLTWDVEMSIHFREVQPGTGSIDYTTFLRRLAALPHEAPLMLEHLSNAEEYANARKYLFDLAPEAGVSFG
jgi:sugar phosphate isomerase/epimerase